MSESKRITLDDVAQRAGVSSQTVSRVVNNHPYVSDDTRRRVMDAIRALDYRPNRAARSLATQRSNMLGIITFGINFYGPAQMLMHAEQAATARGYGVSFAIAGQMTADALRAALDEIGGRAVDGLLLITPTLGVSYDELTKLCGGVPFIQVDTELAAQTPSVVIDQAHGGRLATQHLLDLGHTAISAICGPQEWFGAQARHTSWQQTLRAAGSEPGSCVAGDWTAASGYAAAHELLDGSATFTGLVVGNDQMALGAIRALRERGVRVPEDVSIVGFDDIPEAPYYDPPLTTIRQDFVALSQQSVDYVLALIASPDTPLHQRVLHPQLIVRESTRAV